MTRTDRVWLLVALAAGLVLAFQDLGRQSFWFDEAWSIRIASGSIKDILAEYTRSGAEGPPLYFVLLHGWMHLFGRSEAAVRALSALFHGATVVAGFLLARRLAGSAAAGMSALLMATAPALVFFSQEARNYSMTVFLLLISAACFAEFLRKRSTGALLAVTAVNALGLATHVLMVEVVLLENIVVLAAARDRAAWFRWFPAQILLVPAVIPYLHTATAIHGRASWIPRPTPYSLMNGLMLHTGSRVIEVPFLAGTVGPGRNPLLPIHCLVALLLAVLGVVWTLRRNRPSGAPDGLPSRTAGFLLTGLVVAAFGLPLVLTLLHQDLFVPRYLILGVPAFLILEAIGLRSIARNRIALIGGIAVLVSIHVVITESTMFDRRKDDWREVGRVLTNEVHPGDALIVSDGRAVVPFELYYRGSVPPVPVDGLLGTRPEDAPVIERQLDGLTRPGGILWLVMPWGGAVNDGRTGLWIYLDDRPDRYVPDGQWRTPGSWGGIRVHRYRVAP